MRAGTVAINDTEIVKAADVDFSLAVKLLVQAHERAVGRLQSSVEEPVPISDKIAKVGACAHTLLQPRTSIPTPVALAAITPTNTKEDDVNWTITDEVNLKYMPHRLAHGKGLAQASCETNTNEDVADMTKADELDLKRIPSQALPLAVVNQWYVMVAKLLGCYRVPLKPREIWEISQIHSPAKSKHTTSRVQIKRTISSIEARMMRTASGGSRRTHTVYNVEIFTCFQSILLFLNCRRLVKSSEVLMLHPTSSLRLVWVLLCLPFLFYEILLITMTPFALADMQWAKHVDFFCASFWTVDIGVSFRSGFVVKGSKIEMRPAAVAQHYLRTWFIFDLGIASLQWLTVYEHLTNTSTAAGSLASFAVVRLLRLGRVSKLWNRFNFEDALLANFGAVGHKMTFSMKIGQEVAKGLIAALLIVHCNACGWYEVGKGPDGWRADYGHLLKGNILGDYLVCMHWSLCQFQGNIELDPGRSTKARVFACASSALCLVFLTFFVSALTGTVVSLRDERKRQLRDVTLMSRFLDRQSMPGEVMLRATYYVSSWELQQAERLTHEEDQKALKLFPKGLRGQLMSAIIAPHMVKIPVFVFLKEYHANIFAMICLDSITQRVYALDDDLFTNREPAKYMYVIVSGEVTYNSTSKSLGIINHLLDHVPYEQCTDDNTSEDYSRQVTPMSSGSVESNQDHLRMANDCDTIVRRFDHGGILSEAALWLQYVHEGDLCCRSVSDCLEMCSTSLSEIISRFEDPWRICSEYANRFALVAEDIKESAERRFYIDLLGAADILQYRSQR